MATKKLWTIYTSPYFGKSALKFQKYNPEKGIELIQNFTGYFRKLDEYAKYQQMYAELFESHFQGVQDNSDILPLIDAKMEDLKFYLKIFIEDNLIK